MSQKRRATREDHEQRYSWTTQIPEQYYAAQVAGMTKHVNGLRGIVDRVQHCPHALNTGGVPLSPVVVLEPV